jgi:hypothetical protein
VRQNGVTTFFFLLVSFGQIPLSAQVPPGTGAGGAFNDQNFKIVTETPSAHQSASSRAPAVFVWSRPVCFERSAPSVPATNAADVFDVRTEH